ncbi:MAG: flagellar hook-length control protein FliK, partial [Lachnospiraceae bacterium]|nr:flagellar hook-length control protein FliK [Lachnospiraceae bacterium]
KKDSPASILHKLAEQIQKGDHITKDILTQVFSNKEMQTFLRDILEQQMFLGIKEVAEGERIQKLYKNLASKIDKIDMLLQNTGIKDIPMSQTLADVRGNIEFMNQLNQTYTYAQIPLKMANQNVSAQLYVYTNKRDLSDPERDLTAFLHLDLEHLGGTDVSIHMKKKQVDTKFYMDNDKSFALVQANMPILQERLRQKGYSCTMKVLNEEKKIDFVEDFLKKDAPSTAQLHRYSFDVRA